MTHAAIALFVVLAINVVSKLFFASKLLVGLGWAESAGTFAIVVTVLSVRITAVRLQLVSNYGP